MGITPGRLMNNDKGRALSGRYPIIGYGDGPWEEDGGEVNPTHGKGGRLQSGQPEAFKNHILLDNKRIFRVVFNIELRATGIIQMPTVDVERHGDVIGVVDHAMEFVRHKRHDFSRAK